MFVSSANKISFATGETLQMSLIYTRNNKGPNIDPCGTRQVIWCSSEAQFWKWTNCCVLER